MVAKRLVSDWPIHYGYQPVLLETFVDTTRFRGACYKAGNWTLVGMTKGRSKYDRFHVAANPVKSVWLLPLTKNFRRALLARGAGSAE